MLKTKQNLPPPTPQPTKHLLPQQSQTTPRLQRVPSGQEAELMGSKARTSHTDIIPITPT